MANDLIAKAGSGYQWAKGQSGNPSGKAPNMAKREIQRIMAEPSLLRRDLTNLQHMVHVLLTRGVQGDVVAIKELFDRGYGKPAQAEEDREAAAKVGEAATEMLLAVLGVSKGAA